MRSQSAFHLAGTPRADLDDTLSLHASNVTAQRSAMPKFMHMQSQIPVHQLYHGSHSQTSRTPQSPFRTPTPPNHTTTVANPPTSFHLRIRQKHRSRNKPALRHTSRDTRCPSRQPASSTSVTSNRPLYPSVSSKLNASLTVAELVGGPLGLPPRQWVSIGFSLSPSVTQLCGT